MKALKTRRRVAPAPVVPSLQIDLEGDWRRYTRLLPKFCTVLDVVTIDGDDHGALVWLASDSRKRMNVDCSGEERPTRRYGSPRSKLLSVMSREPWMIRSIRTRSGRAG